MVITFDDAFEHLLEDAVPALMQYGFPATIFVPTAFVGKKAAWLPGGGAALAVLGPRDLTGLHACGFEIAAHSRTHAHLDELPQGAARDEIEGSKRDLEALLGAAVETFAYPFGHHRAETQRLVRAAGYRAACAVGRRLATARDDLTALPRLEVTPWTTPEALVASLSRPQPGALTWLTRRRDEAYGSARRSLRALGLR